MSVDPYSRVLRSGEQTDKVNFFVEVKVTQSAVLALAQVFKIL